VEEGSITIAIAERSDGELSLAGAGVTSTAAASHPDRGLGAPIGQASRSKPPIYRCLLDFRSSIAG
jgi:hypothetical protein